MLIGLKKGLRNWVAKEIHLLSIYLNDFASFYQEIAAKSEYQNALLLT